MARRISAAALTIAQHVDNLDLVARAQKAAQRLFVFAGGDQEVGNQDDGAGWPAHQQQAAHRLGHLCGAARAHRADEGSEGRVGLAPAMQRRGLQAWRAAARGGKRAQAHRVVARHRDIGERSRQAQREAQLVVLARQAHRSARVDQDGDFDFALGPKGADRQIVEPGEGVPIEEAQVVALGVLLEAFGFDAESLHAAEHATPFAHGARTLDSEHQAVEPAEKVGLECARLEHLSQAAQARAGRTAWMTRSTI